MKTTTEVYAIRTKFYKFINYSYIIRDEHTNQILIIDPSWEIKKIKDKIEINDSKVVAICLTHSHYDHTNLVDQLVQIYNPSVFMSKKEIDFYKYRCKNLEGLTDKEEFKFGRTKILCLHSPGHTAGSMSFLSETGIFTGDTLFVEGCGSCFGEGGSAEEMFYTINRLKKIISANTNIYPGHSYGKDPGQPMNQVMKDNIYLQFDKKEDFIKFRIRKNQPELFSFK